MSGCWENICDVVSFPPQGQFNFVHVIITPLDYDCNLVTLQCRKGRTPPAPDSVLLCCAAGTACAGQRICVSKVKTSRRTSLKPVCWPVVSGDVLGGHLPKIRGVFPEHLLPAQVTVPAELSWSLQRWLGHAGADGKWRSPGLWPVVPSGSAVLVPWSERCLLSSCPRGSSGVVWFL